MEEKKWITTEQMLEALKNDPDNEHEYNLSLAGGVLTEAEILEYYSGCLWNRYS